jgi:hypothetical protein
MDRKDRRRKFEHSAAVELTGGSEPGNGVSGPRAIRAEQLMKWPLMFAAALTLPAVILGETREVGALSDIAQILNWGTWLAFLAEFTIMLALVPDRWKYIRHHPVEVVVVFLTPPILPPGLQALRAIRLLRLLRLLKLAQLSRNVFSGQGLLYAALMTTVMALAGGSAFRAFEAGNQKLTEWEGAYWAVTTMTTLGSQYEATTTGSEIVEIVILLIGVTFFAMLTGAIAQRFLNPPPAEEPAPQPDVEQPRT